MSVDPPQADRFKEFFLFYSLRIAERACFAKLATQAKSEPSIRSASGGSFIIRHSLKFHLRVSGTALNAHGEFCLT